MSSSRVGVVSVLGALILTFAGCVSRNPRSCFDGVCTDDAFPFCDVDGAVGGAANTCIAVSCSPSEFAACSGDSAVTCNADATGYDVTSCPHGCSSEARSCNACEPNTSACGPNG